MTKIKDPAFTGLLSAAPFDGPSMALVSSTSVLLPEQTLYTATRIRMALSDTDRTIAFTGLADSDLASQLAQGIAVAFSQFAPGQVVLVSAGPAPETEMGTGLAEVLSGERPLSAALGEPQAGGPWILPAGNMPENRSNLFFSAECAAVFAALSQRFRYVLVDCGTLAAPASLVVIGRCDTVAFALEAGPHHRSEVLRAKSELARVKSRLLGVVLTEKKR